MSTGTAISSAALCDAREPTTTSTAASCTVERMSVMSCVTVSFCLDGHLDRHRRVADDLRADGSRTGRDAEESVVAGGSRLSANGRAIDREQRARNGRAGRIDDATADRADLRVHGSGRGRDGEDGKLRGVPGTKSAYDLRERAKGNRSLILHRDRGRRKGRRPEGRGNGERERWLRRHRVASWPVLSTSVLRRRFQASG